MNKYQPGATKSVVPTMTKHLLMALVLAFPVATLAQSMQNDGEERHRALQLYDENKFTEAIPILEKLALVHPSDTVILERLGWATFVVSGSMKNPDARKKARARALGFFTRAKDLGDDSELLQAGLEALSLPDDAGVPLSKNKEAEAALREGEEAHSQGKLDKAIEGYKRAFELDPKLYLAPLFAGDMYFKKGVAATDLAGKKQLMAAAGEWFSRAIAIDENVETAHRYWGDALDAEGRTEEARDKFVEAIVAEPYNRSPYVGLMQWSERHKVSMGHPRIDIPTNVTSKKPGEISITIDDLALKGSDKDGSAAWMIYGLIRSTWMDKKEGGRSEKFAKAYPTESAYRHSLAEEVDALRAVLMSVQEQKKEKPSMKLTPSLENLIKLNAAGLTEAYVLFVRPNEGIALDYSAYRNSHRDKLRQYWLKFVVGAK